MSQIPRVAGEYDLKVPRDMAYVFSGAYVPLSCRVIEQVLRRAPLPSAFLGPSRWHLASAGPLISLQVLERRSWQGLEEVVRLLNCGELLFAGMEGCGEP